jgi:hypothetical protein
MNFAPTYRVNVRPLYPYSPRLGLHPLTAERVAERLGEGLVSDVIENAYLDFTVVADLPRESHDAALQELLVALQMQGWEIVNATITEWTDRMGEGLLGGGGIGGTIGLSTKNEAMTFFVLAAGCVVGAIYGSTLRKAERVIVAEPTPFGWQFQEIRLAEAPAFLVAHA